MLLKLYLGLKLAQHLIELNLSRLNVRYYTDLGRLNSAADELQLERSELEKAVEYSITKTRFSGFKSTIMLMVTLVFLAWGGLGYFEYISQQVAAWAGSSHEVVIGVIFFGLLTLVSLIGGLPFSLYFSFVIEEKFGFNKQTLGGFFLDLLKSLALMALIGVPIMALILWIISSSGENWWILAWGVLSLVSLTMAWLFPTLLAPIFNKFSPLEDGELKSGIESLAQKVGFNASGVSVMDASKRSSHGNAYFTGVFGKKRIVLFDTLVKDLSTKEVLAVLAHELGHFKLNHVRNSIVRSFVVSFVTFYLMSLFIKQSAPFAAFTLESGTAYGGLLVFFLWFSFVEFFMQPVESWMSRKNEFAADRFAREVLGSGEDLVKALLKMRDKSLVVPISHPLYSRIYYSHPPLLERLRALLPSKKMNLSK
jgi:STE24 endopeptidase